MAEQARLMAPRQILRRASASNPGRERLLCVYAAITECIGKTNVELRIVDVNEQKPAVLSSPGTVDSTDPLAVLDLAFFFSNPAFPEPGEYRVQLFAAGIPVMERRLMAVQVQPSSSEEVEHE